MADSITKSTIDHRGPGDWSADAIGARYRRHCSLLHVTAEELTPRRDESEDATRFHPLMERIIDGIERGDAGCIEIGVEFVEQDQSFAFGAILKSNTARALRRAFGRGQISGVQCNRLRERFLSMLAAGNTPREFGQYVRLLRHIGLSEVPLRSVVESAPARPTHSTKRFLAYLERFVR